MKRLALLVLCAFATPAAAEINMVDSVEWQTIDSQVVVRGFVSAVTKHKGEGDVTYFDATVTITETIKGGVKKTIHVGVRDVSGARPEDWKKAKTDLLLFLVDGKTHAEDDKELAKYSWILREPHGSTNNPVLLGTSNAYTGSFAVLTKPTDVLAAVRTAVRSTATKSHRVDVPWHTPAQRALYGGSVVWMTLPVDAALEKLAIAWIGEASTREDGALALANFKSDANIERMKKLLSDPSFSEVSETGKPTMKRYAVRAAAHKALEDWNVTHAKPVLEEKK